MVDVSAKADTVRTAVARGSIYVGRTVFEAVGNHTATKGDVLGVARVAGIMATKRTWELIPMCHPLMLTKVSIDFRVIEESFEIETTCTVGLTGKTGVEMEALTGATVALLTIYDMCKAMNKDMVIREICLMDKTGGKSGDYGRR
ncbi:cyclic pyranopterin monophosphate synthase MoaC [Lachnospiraceae bacterium ZAX-1]